jgi:very-short-patch-repair endonuclease
MYSNHFYNKNLKQFARELRSETVSKAEKRIWKALLSRKQTGERFLRQRPIKNFIVDFFCPELKLIIEIDGNSHFHKPEYDAYRERQLKELGFEIIRFKEGDVLNNLDKVSNQITHCIYCLRQKL